jgi:phosphoglycerate dehydrogenase-like enzyme
MTYCLLTRFFSDSDIAQLRNQLHPSIQLLRPNGFDDADLLAQLDQYPVEIFLGTVPSSAVLARARHLRLIQIPWNGLDNAGLPVECDPQIQICNSHSNATAAAELAVSLMLALLKFIPLHDAALRQNQWRRPGGTLPFRPPEPLAGKSIGIAGYGHIGNEIRKMLAGFAVSVTALNQTGCDRFQSGIPVFPATQLAAFLAGCDVLFLALPLTAKTRDFISAPEFSQMKKNCYLINISRAALVNEEALYHALESGALAGAALDCWYTDPERGASFAVPSRFPFQKLENVVLSPHRGGFLKGQLPHFSDVIDNLNRFAEGRPLINVVNLAECY